MSKETKGAQIYTFGAGEADGDRSMKELLGGKGANLAEMSSIGLPVPAGFTISTEACHYYSTHNGEWPKGLKNQMKEGVKFIEEIMGTHLGDSEHPLLLSVRSGAAKSMPGMMDTVLNLGLNDAVAQGLAQKMENERAAFDAYRRFID